MRLSEVQAYLDGPFQQIHGWCIPHLWQVIQPIAEILDERQIRNPIAEIGVFHGKFFIGLAKTIGTQPNYAIDVFSMQQFNLDKAGNGNLETFHRNCADSGLAPGAVVPLERDSMTITQEDIAQLRRATGGFSMFSVDGCHTAEHTMNDTRLAMELTIPEGLIFVDDYYNAAWPGVQEGISKMFFFDNPRFVPLACTCNKLILCHISHHATYLNRLVTTIKQRFPKTAMKRVRRFGYDTLNVSPRLSDKTYLFAA